MRIGPVYISAVFDWKDWRLGFAFDRMTMGTASNGDVFAIKKWTRTTFVYLHVLPMVRLALTHSRETTVGGAE